MAQDGPDGGTDAAALVDAVVSDPVAGRERLPQLLGLLDADEPRHRLSAAWALTLVAEASPGVVAPLTRRLADRIGDEPDGADGPGEDSGDEADTRLVAELALTYLRWRYPETVDETLDALAEEAAERERRALFRRLAADTGRGPGDDRDGDRAVGRTQLPGGGDGGARRVYRREGYDVGGAPADARSEDPAADGTAPADEDPAGDGPEADQHAESAGDGRDTETATDPPAAPDGTAGSNRTEWRRGLAAVERAVGLDDVLAQSVFDDLALVAPAVEGRFTDVYRVRAARDGSEAGIALRVFHPPEGDEVAFADAVVDGLSNWDALSAHDLVVDLYDWGDRPRPWLATEYTTTTLYDRTGLGDEEAVWNCLKVAEAISHAHEHGVLHTGLDPFSVVYTDAVLEDRQRPHVAHFGLLDAVRAHVDPAAYLDPRYAAPEYFDASFGEVDQATDIYGLGAVIYTLVTGQPPYTGEYASVRRSVLSEPPPQPTDADKGSPDWVDRVVRKAMARQKLTRYESAAQLTADVRREVEG